MFVISPIDTVLLSPRNDEESLQILKLAKAMEIPTVISNQPHGARLANEEKLLERLRAANPHAKYVVIIEIPGPEVEGKLSAAGYQVIVIDHHQYEGLDRMKNESSLEQFLQTFGLDDAQLCELGFEPSLVRGVGIIDRGFLWELKREGYSFEEARKARDYYRRLSEELGGDVQSSEVVVREAWQKKEIKNGISIYRSTNEKVHIREAISFLVADVYDEPPTSIIVEGDGQISVQDTVKATKLFKQFGGYLFGKNLCWGFQPRSDKKTPSIDQILTVLLE